MERGLVALLRQPALHSMRNIVCTMRSGGPLLEELPGHVETEVLGIEGRRPLSALRLARVFAKHRPRIVHARNYNTWSDCVLACHLSPDPRRVPVFGFHGLESDGGFSGRQARRVRWLGLSSQLFTTVSSAGTRQLQGELGIPPEQIHLLVNGVDSHHFAPADGCARRTAREQLGIGPDELVVVMVGALVSVKDHACALDAARRVGTNLGRLRLLIVGEGPLRGALQTQARTLPSNIHTTLLSTRRDVVDILHAGDLFVLPSRYEQMSQALLEAMATGMAVVATDVGDNERIVEHGRSGLIVAPRDPGALGQAMEFLLGDGARRRRLGEAGRASVTERFEAWATADAYARFYELLPALTQPRINQCAASPV